MLSLDLILSAITTGVTNLAIQVIQEGGNSALKQIDIDLTQKGKLEKAIKKYIESYNKEYGILKISCVKMDRPIHLDNVYTTVKLLERSSKWSYFESEEALKNLILKKGTRGFDVHPKQKFEGISVANDKQYLMVLGGPGIGKSTFLKKIGLEALKKIGLDASDSSDLRYRISAYKHKCIPVMVELRDFNPTKNTLEGFIAKQFEACGFPDEYCFVQSALESGKFLILLDGIDEVPDSYVNQVIKVIRDFVKAYPDNRFIASCREAAYIFGGFTRFQDIAMASFDDYQIKQFINNWFSAENKNNKEKKLGEQCWNLINTQEYKAAKELAQTPLLLTLLCTVYSQLGSFPKNRSALYGEALEVFLRKWAAEKMLETNSIYKDLSPELEQMLLSEMAFMTFKQKQLFFSKKASVDYIKRFLVNNLNAPQTLNGEAILSAIEVQQGILVERARDTYSFSHLTLQEYLSAQYIVYNQLINDLVQDYLFDERWQEIFMLTSGLMRGARGVFSLLEQMNKQLLKKIYKNQQVTQVVAYVEKLTEVESSNFSAVARRALAIYFIRILQECRKGNFRFQSSKDIICNRAASLAINISPIQDKERIQRLTRVLDWPIVFIKEFSNLKIEATNAKERGFHYLRSDTHNKRTGCLAMLKVLINLNIFSNQYLHIVEERMDGIRNDPLNCDIRDILALYNSFLSFDDVELADLAGKDSTYFIYLLYVTELIGKCKESAVTISRDDWRKIEQNMLKLL